MAVRERARLSSSDSASSLAALMPDDVPAPPGRLTDVPVAGPAPRALVGRLLPNDTVFQSCEGSGFLGGERRTTEGFARGWGERSSPDPAALHAAAFFCAWVWAFTRCLLLDTSETRLGRPPETNFFWGPVAEVLVVLNTLSPQDGSFKRQISSVRGAIVQQQ